MRRLASLRKASCSCTGTGLLSREQPGSAFLTTYRRSGEDVTDAVPLGWLLGTVLFSLPAVRQPL
ncbi:hypothetical protein GCM10010106_43420 [Thermopolyspora flexuosa]|nr:hypothetical protein GCM10010106_43420 [Thermopolyspora flexuosa]